MRSSGPIDLSRPGTFQRVEQVGVHRPIGPRRRRRDNLGNSRRLSKSRRHERSRDERSLSSRHIDANPVEGHKAFAHNRTLGIF